MIWIVHFLELITVVSAGAAAFSESHRGVALSLWVAGVSTSALLLLKNCELLGMFLALSSTGLSLVWVFHSMRLSRYERDKLNWRTFFSGILAVGFGVVVDLTFRGLSIVEAQKANESESGINMGREVIQNHWLTLELVALFLVVVLVGAGLLVRQEEITE